MRMSDEEQAKRYNMSLKEFQELMQWNSDENLKDMIRDLEEKPLPNVSLEKQWETLKNNYESGNYNKYTLLCCIEDIDNNTPWSEVEPDWWVEMMDYERKVRKVGKYN